MKKERRGTSHILRKITAVLAVCALILTSGALVPAVSGVFGISNVPEISHFPGIPEARANSAQWFWEGITATGALVTDENCPIEVEREVLTFDIPEFPKSYYETESEFGEYSAKVTAKYTFYNPADYTVKAVLRFPFGGTPQYAYNGMNPREGMQETDCIGGGDTAKFNILVNGSVIEKTLRHSLFYSYEQFNLGKDMALLEDDFSASSPYSPDTAVYKYVYRVEGVSSEYGAANAALDLPLDGGDDILIAEECGIRSLVGDKRRASTWVKDGSHITVYSFKEPLTGALPWKIYKDGAVKDGDEAEGSVTQVESRSMTFKDLALTAYRAGGDVSETDWYNAFVHANFSEGRTWQELMQEFKQEFKYDVSGDLMRWYEYRFVLAPRELIVNTVEAPLYPSIDSSFEPAVYSYNYLLSPAKTWARFGKLDIVVNTPYYMTKSSLGEFQRTEGADAAEAEPKPEAEFEAEAEFETEAEAETEAKADEKNASAGTEAADGTAAYTLSLPGLPEGELEFSLCTSAQPTSRSGKNIKTFAIVLLVAAVILIVIIIPAVVVLRKVFGLFMPKKGRNRRDDD